MEANVDRQSVVAMHKLHKLVMVSVITEQKISNCKQSTAMEGHIAAMEAHSKGVSATNTGQNSLKVDVRANRLLQIRILGTCQSTSAVGGESLDT